MESQICAGHTLLLNHKMKMKYKGTNTFCPEDGCISLFRNVGKILLDYTASHFRRQYSSLVLLWEAQFLWALCSPYWRHCTWILQSSLALYRVAQQQWNARHAGLTKPIKQQFVITHRYTLSQETETLDWSSIDWQFSMFCFHKNIRTSNFLWAQLFDRRSVCNPAV